MKTHELARENTQENTKNFSRDLFKNKLEHRFIQTRRSLVIALTSPASGCGKTTILKYLSDKYDAYPTHLKTPFTDMLKVLLRSAGMGHDEIMRSFEGNLRDVKLKTFGYKTPRELQILLGQHWGHGMVSQDIWVDLWKLQLHTAPLVVVDDIRQPNEYEAVRGNDGILVRVMRDQNNGRQAVDGLIDNLQVHHTIYNSGTVEELHAQIDVMMAVIGRTL